MDVIERIIYLKDIKGYSTNKLASLSDLTQSTLQSIISKRNMPSIFTLEKICNGLDISLSDFFNDSDELSPDLMQLLNNAKKLTPEQLDKLNDFIKTL